MSTGSRCEGNKCDRTQCSTTGTMLDFHEANTCVGPTISPTGYAAVQLLNLCLILCNMDMVIELTSWGGSNKFKRVWNFDVRERRAAAQMKAKILAETGKKSEAYPFFLLGEHTQVKKVIKLLRSALLIINRENHFFNLHRLLPKKMNVFNSDLLWLSFTLLCASLRIDRSGLPHPFLDVNNHVHNYSILL